MARARTSGVRNAVAVDAQPRVNQVSAAADALDELVFSLGHGEMSDLLRRLSGARRLVTVVHRFMRDLREVLRAAPARLTPETAVLLRDTLDDVLSSQARLEEAKATLEAAASNYLALVSVQVAAASQRVGDTANRVTLVATVLLPLTLVASFFGMNVRVPFGAADSLVPFFVICATISLFGVALTALLFRRLHPKAP